MRYQHIVISHHGDASVLQLVEDDLPELQPDRVRIKILAASVGFVINRLF
jgi:NADPH:quinone reductase-like Zn-dependent oxidoreductase